MTNYEQSNQWRYAPGTQNGQDNSMRYCPAHNMIHVIMLMDQNQRAFNSSYSSYQEPSSLEHTFNSFMQNCPTSPPNFSFENSSSLDYASTQSFLQDLYKSFHQP
ncbi:hypothetical protein AHAS_Ahas11G0191600 [Arachis hypogaea]